MNDKKRKTPQRDETGALFPEAGITGYFVATMGGAWVKISDDWILRFDTILQDNRCPQRMVCATAGFATAKVYFQQPVVAYEVGYFEKMQVSGLNRYPPTNKLKPSLFKTIHITGTPIKGRDIDLDIALVDLIPYPDLEKDHPEPTIPVALFRIFKKINRSD